MDGQNWLLLITILEGYSFRWALQRGCRGVPWPVPEEVECSWGHPSTTFSTWGNLKHPLSIWQPQCSCNGSLLSSSMIRLSSTQMRATLTVGQRMDMHKVIGTLTRVISYSRKVSGSSLSMGMTMEATGWTTTFCTDRGFKAAIHNIIFIFYQSSNHSAFSYDLLNAFNISYITALQGMSISYQ